MKARLTLFVGPMFAGKTTALLEAYENHHRVNPCKALLVKPASDTRYSKVKVVTHEGKSIECVRVKGFGVSSDNSIEGYNRATAVFIDEAQFALGNVMEFIHRALANNKDVYAAGLDVDSRGEKFEVIADMMAHADNVIKLKGACGVCGGIARYSFEYSKKTEGDTDIAKLGGAERYKALCRVCLHRAKEQEGSK